MNELTKILSEGRKYDFKGDYLVQRPITDFQRHSYSFSGNLICLSEQRVLGHMSYSLNPDKSYLILGLLNEDELQFSQMSTCDRRVYSLKLQNQFRLKLEGKCKQIWDLKNFSEMLVNLSEINDCSVHDVKNFNFDLLSKISRERLLPYFQKGQLDNATGQKSNFASIYLREV